MLAYPFGQPVSTAAADRCGLPPTSHPMLRLGPAAAAPQRGEFARQDDAYAAEELRATLPADGRFAVGLRLPYRASPDATARTARFQRVRLDDPAARAVAHQSPPK